MNTHFPAENVSIKPIVATRSFPMYVVHYYNVPVFVPLRFLHRHINEHQSTSIIRIPHHCLIIIGLCLRPQVCTLSH